MSLPRYPKYKASGVEWLGEVPEHWEVKPNKTFLTHSQKLVGESWKERQLLSLTLKGVIDRDIHSGHGKYPSDFGTYQEVAVGDLVFCLFDMDETPRTVGLAGSVGMITSAYDVFRCRSTALANFVVYYFLHIDSFKGLRPFYTGLRKVVRPPTFMSIKVPMPPIGEQTKIASFLDRETSKIDGLVGEQRRLIELLKEKRQAVISHAVTKGLNPHTPLKPSGIEWLGDVPTAWTVTKLGRAAFMQEGPGLRTWQFTDEGTRVICVTNITESGIDFARLEKFISTDEYNSSYTHFTVQTGDVLLSSSGNSWGKVAIYEGDEKVMLNTSTIRLNESAGSPLIRDFLAILLQSDTIREQLGLAMTGSCQPNFGPSHLKSVMVAVPSRQEQSNIVAFVARETAKLDALTAEAERGIELLQERRTALISAAVTGQIDVRGLVETEAA